MSSMSCDQILQQGRAIDNKNSDIKQNGLRNSFKSLSITSMKNFKKQILGTKKASTTMSQY